MNTPSTINKWADPSTGISRWKSKREDELPLCDDKVLYKRLVPFK